MASHLPLCGVGLGLRRPHVAEAAQLPEGRVPFWEVAPENHLGEGGSLSRLAESILERHPGVSHGLSQSVGNLGAWDPSYLASLSEFLGRLQAPWHSEHLCFSAAEGTYTHELLPLPFTREAARHAANRARELQDRLQRPLLLENITYYGELAPGEMSEGQFIAEVLEQSDTGWLLDINNVYVNALNFGFDPKDWLAAMPLHRVTQMHIAGHEQGETFVVDTHGSPVEDPVIELMAWTLTRLGRAVPVLLERDHHLPSLETLLHERDRIQAAYDRALDVPSTREVVHA